MTSSAAELFCGAESLLQATLDNIAPQPRADRRTLDENASAQYLDVGVLEIMVHEDAPRIVLSAGVHGNETAPVEILNGISNDIIKGTLQPTCNLLILFANPEALRAGTRFVDINMNRLFEAHELANGHTQEHERAAALTDHVARFVGDAGESALHLDLHTTIRSSRIERFAMCPDAGDTHARAAAFTQLGHWDIGAVVISDQTRTTFSAWSFHTLGARSFTLELGRALPFGENDLSQFEAFEAGLRQQIAGEIPMTAEDNIPPVFVVNREIKRTADDFTLHFPDDVPNFTETTGNQLLATDGSTAIHAESGERLLFPNANVALDQRALVLIKPAA